MSKFCNSRKLAVQAMRRGASATRLTKKETRNHALRFDFWSTNARQQSIQVVPTRLEGDAQAPQAEHPAAGYDQRSARAVQGHGSDEHERRCRCRSIAARRVIARAALPFSVILPQSPRVSATPNTLRTTESRFRTAFPLSRSIDPPRTNQIPPHFRNT